MASPFNLFRKNQRAMMVVVGIGCMVGFLLGGMGIIESIQPGGGGYGEADEVVVSWDGGELTRYDLDRLRMRRGLTLQFLVAVAHETVNNREGMPKGPGVSVDQQGNIRSLGISQDTSDRAIVFTRLIAEEAREMGFTVSDADVNRFVSQISDGTLSDNELSAMLKRVAGDNMTDAQLFESLRYELLARKLETLGSQSGVAFSTPGEIWQYYNRLNRQVEAELIPIAVSDFTDEVKPPTTAQLRAFYEKHKNRAPHPASPDPGFRQRQQLAFGYFQAEFDQFMEGPEGALAQVTEQEIREYYEENKDASFRVREPLQFEDERPASDEPASDQPASDASDPAEPAAETPPPQTPADDSADQPAVEPPADDEAPASTDTPAAETPADDLPADDMPAEDAPTEDAPTEDAPTEDAPPAASDADEPAQPSENQQSRRFAGGVRLVAYQPAAEPADADEPVVVEQPADPSADADDAPADEAADTVPSDTVPSDAEANGDAPETPADVPAEQPPADPAIAEQPAAATPSAETKPKYTPLEEVRDEIRRSIAQPRAFEKMTEALKAVERQLEPYHLLYLEVESLSKFKDDRKVAAQLVDAKKRFAAATPDYQAIARQYGLTYGKIPLVDQFDVQNYPLGQASTFDRQTFQQVPFASLVYGDNPVLFKPRTIGSLTRRNQQFLFWMTDNREPRVPAFSEVYDESAKSGPVLDAWKMEQALPLARQRAEQLAAEAAKSEQSLQEQFQDNENLTVLKTNRFSWLSSGSMPLEFGGSLQLSEVAGVEFAGHEFMQEVFLLEVGETGVATNQPHTEVYVVRLTDQAPSPEVLQSQFAQRQANPDRGLLIAMNQVTNGERGRAYQGWLEDMEQRHNLQWHQ